MKKKLYVETSVWNQLEHDDRLDWRETTEFFFAAVMRGEYEIFISNVVLDEILATPNMELQVRLANHINRLQPAILVLDEEATSLTGHYIEAGFGGIHVSQRIYRDCCHIAVATVNDIKHVVSFNCKHLVNDRRIDGFNAINLQHGYDLMVDITTPHRFLGENSLEVEL